MSNPSTLPSIRRLRSDDRATIDALVPSIRFARRLGVHRKAQGPTR